MKQIQAIKLIASLEEECEKLDYREAATKCAETIWPVAIKITERYFGEFVISPRLIVYRDRPGGGYALTFEVENNELVWLGYVFSSFIGDLYEDIGVSKNLIPYIEFYTNVHELIHLKQAEIIVRKHLEEKGKKLESEDELQRFLGRGNKRLVKLLEIRDKLLIQDPLWGEGIAFWGDKFICNLFAEQYNEQKFLQAREITQNIVNYPWHIERKRLSRLYCQDIQLAVRKRKDKLTPRDKEMLIDFVKIVEETPESTAEKVYLRLFDVCIWKSMKRRLNRGMLYLHPESLGKSREELGGIFQYHYRKTYGFGAELTQRIYEKGGLDEIRRALNEAPVDYEEYVNTVLNDNKRELDLEKAREAAERFKNYEIQLNSGR